MVVAGNALSSRLIEGFGGGRWSHMANLLADDTVLDARYDSVHYGGKAHAPGVQLRPAHYLDSEPRWAVFEFGEPWMYPIWEQAGLGQIGKPYDSVGIKGFARGLFTGHYEDRNYAPRDPSKSKAWFCDELAVYMAQRCGHLPELPFQPYTLTPGAALNLFIGRGARLMATQG